MTTDYPVRVDVVSPVRFDRVQLLLRILLAIVLAFVGITGGWLVCLLYGALPVIAAIEISALGGEAYVRDVEPRVWRLLAWLLRVAAYMNLLVDRFPTANEGPVAIEIRFTGKPTVRSALARLITSIPSGLVLMLLWCISCFVWLVSAAMVLVDAKIPPSLLAFQRGVLRWSARLVAYHASLVAEYPPFAFDTDRSAPIAAAGAG
jgi:hypothetical protein